MASLIQFKSNTASSATSVSAVFTSAVTLGSTIVVCSSTAPPTATVSDTRGNTYVQSSLGSIWYALNCAAGATTVTINFGTTSGYLPIIAQEYTKASSGGGVDQNTFATGTSTTPTGAVTTTTVANELVVAYCTNGQNATQGAGYTYVDNSTGDCVEYGTQATAAAFQATFVQINAQWFVFTLTFKPSGTAFTKTVTDALTLADVLKKSPVKVRVDSYTLTDVGLVKKPQKLWAEALTLADVIAKAKTMFRVLSDAVTVAESLVRSTARSVAESFSLADVFAAARAKFLTLTDALTVADSLARAAGRQFLDAITQAEGFARSTSRRVSDALNLSDVFAYASVKMRAFAEAFDLTEGLQRSVGKRLSDGLTLFDGAARVIARRFAEALTVLDALARSTGRVLSEALEVGDSVVRLVERSLSDAFDLAEAWAFNLVRGLGLYPRKFLAVLLARLWAAVGVPLRSMQAVAGVRVFQATTEEIMIYTDPKDPESAEDFQIDWSAAAQGDAIVTSTWEVPDDLTVLASNHTTTLATARIAGGVAGQRYPVKNLVTCASGQIRVQALLIPVVI